MLGSLADFGPDGCGLLADGLLYQLNRGFGATDFQALDEARSRASRAHGQVALGHQLLRITPEDDWEEQPLAMPSLRNSREEPMASAAGGRLDADAWLVADARIDNRSELTAEFGLSGNEAARMPDSAFVLKAWQRWGRESVQHLVGSFAFAVWDAGAEQFFLARDHSGDRPLYYCGTEQFFAFATTARAVRTCPGVSSELDERQLARDLIGLPPEYPRTRFRDVRQLAPGQCMVVGRDGAEVWRYWRIDSLAPIRFARDEDYVDAFLEIFDEAVRCRLRTRGGVAAELSAGLDSGSVAATAAGLLAREGRNISAYTTVPCPAFSGAGTRDS
jgi:asparagine synthase (glutamine-hydrolysing)